MSTRIIDASAYSEKLEKCMLQLAGKEAEETQEEADTRVMEKCTLFQDLGIVKAKQQYPDHFRRRAPQIYKDDDSADALHRFVVPGHFAFSIQRYPACCGALMFHHFDYTCDEFSAELVKPLMDEILTLDANDYLWGLYRNNRRLILVMVQTGGFTKKKDGSYDPGANPDKYMVYPKFYEFFKKYAVNTTYMFNTNSLNLLHHMEVIIP